MADTSRMGLTHILIGFYFSNLINAFNVGIKNPQIYSAGGANSYFGYSIAFQTRTKNLIVGAPFSTDTNKGTKNWGSVFQCDYQKENTGRKCSKLEYIDTKSFNDEIKDGQMMGATVYADHDNVVACAPRYMIHESTESGPRKWVPGKCDIMNPFDSSSNWVWKPCVKHLGEKETFRFCQTGFSAKIFKSSQILAGCPTYTKTVDSKDVTRGLLGVSHLGQVSGSTKFTSEANLNYSDYLGYSVATGKFSPSGLAIVGGAPRANLLSGQVILYKITDGKYESLQAVSDPANKAGSYFGSAVVSADINNNNFDDLIVGAPYYSSGVAPNEGAVYVYLNSGTDNGISLAQTIYGDKQGNSCFGFSIGSIGDLNRDQNNDIVVGAPWGGEDGKGVVYVYYGQSSVVEPLVFKQKLLPKALDSGLDGFGYSFAEYYPYTAPDVPADIIMNDVDYNEYPDLAIGAYRSNQVVILRSRPVITINGKLDLGGATNIDLYDEKNRCTAPDGVIYKCLEVTASFELTGVGIGKGAEISYELEIDSVQTGAKRGFFLEKKGDAKSSIMKTSMNVLTSKKGTQMYKAYLVNNTKDIFREMVVALRWGIDAGACTEEVCPVASEMLRKMTQVKIPYIKGCSSDGNEICNTDLKITMTYSLQSGGNTIQYGITDLVDIHVTIENKRENAFINKLKIVYPNEIEPNKVLIENYPGTVIWDPNASLMEDKNTLDVTLSSPIKQNAVEKIMVQFGVSTIKSGTDLINLEATAASESTEMAPADNVARVSIPVKLVANLTVTGNVIPEQVRWTEGVTSDKVPGELIKHEFLFQNQGPSSADTSEILIKFPEKIDGKYFLNVVDVQLEGPSKFSKIGTCDTGGRLNPLGLEGYNNVTVAAFTGGNTTRRRREAEKSLACGSGDGVECRIIKCTLKLLKKSQSATAIIKSTLVEATFETYISANRKISVYAKFTSNVDKPAIDAAKDHYTVDMMVISPHITIEGKREPIKWWVILLCVLAALVIICGVVAILKKKGFFERKKHEDAEEQENLRQDELDDE